MRAALRPAATQDGLAYLTTVADRGGPRKLGYRTRTGALIRVNGIAAGAFDREHPAMSCEFPPNANISLEVELRALPTNGLPSGPGLRWWLMNLCAAQRPSQTLRIDTAQAVAETDDRSATLPLIGHSHLDVAWLWTYAQTRRKAARTVAIALNLLDQHPEFKFTQSQPQLYEFVRAGDAELFERMREFASEKRFDVSAAALWVESDCNLPSGESLLRQMLFAHRFCIEHFAQAPEVAWLPDSFGFANTLPTLLAHAGIRYFVTTKLQWNDTTRFAHPQFRWRGPDGSEVVAALIDSYDGGFNPRRVARARARHEPLIAGYGDGGGGVTDDMVRQATHVGQWIRAIDWLRTLDRDALPLHQDELYLEYHRGVYTTHHDVKRRNAQLERMLAEAESAVARCIAGRQRADEVRDWCRDLHEAWTFLLRNQFHDVLPGTSIAEVYADVHQEYDRAEELIQRVLQRAYGVVPRPRKGEPRSIVPEQAADGYVLRNGFIEARVLPDGSIASLRTTSGRNLVSRANVLTLYRDRPRQWDAWNIDADYRNQKWPPQMGVAWIDDDALFVPMSFGKSQFELQIRLREGERFLRVALNGDWRERHTLMRCENVFSVETDFVVYGTPHGTIERSALQRSAAERAKFEVPGQRFALARSDASAVAMLTLDTYGWSAHRDRVGLHAGHSLLRSPMWPHRDADAGRQMLTYAFAPLEDHSIASVERLWQRFAGQCEPQLFTCDDSAAIVAACKPAQDGNGVIVRLRECDGIAREVHVRCEQRMTFVERADALERPLGGTLSHDDASFRTTLTPFALQSFRVRF